MKSLSFKGYLLKMKSQISRKIWEMMFSFLSKSHTHTSLQQESFCSRDGWVLNSRESIFIMLTQPESFNCPPYGWFRKGPENNLYDIIFSTLQRRQ